MIAKLDSSNVRGFRRLSWLLFLAALGLFGLAAWLAWLPLAGREHLTIENPEQSFAAVPLKQEQPVRFRVRNSGGRPLRVLGYQDC